MSRVRAGMDVNRGENVSVNLGICVDAGKYKSKKNIFPQMTINF